MSDDRDKKRINPYLESLSNKELEDMLMQDFMVSGEDATDGLDIEEVMEVVYKREKKEPDYTPPDVNKAWAEFKEFYQDQEIEKDLEELFPDKLSDMSKKAESSPSNSVIKVKFPQADGAKSRRPRKLRSLGRVAVLVAMVTILSCGVASAFGFDIFQAVADWTAETFGFSRTIEGPEQVGTNPSGNPFKSLEVRVAQVTDSKLVPSASMEVEATSEAQVSERPDCKKLSCNYNFRDSKREFSINIRVFPELPEKYKRVYQKDDNEVKEFVVNGITHYLMQNNETATATWTNGAAECVIQGDLTMEELEKMVESIYKE